MRSILAFSLILCLLLSLPACAPTAPRDPFAYAAAPFSLFVEGTYDLSDGGETPPRPFSAEISFGAPVGGDPTIRDLTVTFTSPETLAGVTVKATLSPAPEGAVTRTVTFTYPTAYGIVELDSTNNGQDGLLRYAEAWLPVGDVAEVSPKSPDGGYTVTRRREGREAVFTFAEGQTLPVGVRLTDGRGIVEMRLTDSAKNTSPS